MKKSCRPCGESKRSWGLLMLRISVAVIFITHGWGKLFGDAPGMENFTNMLSGLNVPMPEVMAYVVALVEFVGGIAVLLGIGTTIAGVLLAAVMLVAFSLVKKFALGAGDVDIALFGSAVAITLAGPGKYSISCLLKKKMSKQQKSKDPITQDEMKDMDAGKN